MNTTTKPLNKFQRLFLFSNNDNLYREGAMDARTAKDLMLYFGLRKQVVKTLLHGLLAYPCAFAVKCL